ncbi:MAG TPA: glucose 1-dehydrogenase [Spongiibacteraceae bacterium]|nr:glucose 1-dehydrogenase [Spongiibacteraceae bacterium]
MTRLAAKVALITGAGRGLGEAIARRFAAEGARLVLTDIDGAAVQAVARSLPAAIGIQHDVSQEAGWQQVVEQAQTTYGGLDILVNNAGVFRLEPLLDTRLEDYQKVIAINQTGCFLGMKTAAPLMIKNGGGSIVNISSAQGIEGLRGAGAYVASKFAVRGMTKVAAIEFAEHGIRVNSIHPGAIATDMSAAGLDKFATDKPWRSPIDDLLIRRRAEPAEIAALVLFVASDEASYSTGSEFCADGGMMAGPPI